MTVALTWTMMTVSLAPPSPSLGKPRQVEIVTSNKLESRRNSKWPNTIVLE